MRTRPKKSVDETDFLRYGSGMSKNRRPHRTAKPYQDALQWLIDNDDVTYMDELLATEPGEEPPAPLVTVCLVADLYDRSDEEIQADLRKLLAKQKKAS